MNATSLTPAGADYSAIKEWFLTRHRQPTRAELRDLVEPGNPKISAGTTTIEA
jgi:hypothetical protein